MSSSFLYSTCIIWEFEIWCSNDVWKTSYLKFDPYRPLIWSLTLYKVLFEIWHQMTWCLKVYPTWPRIWNLTQNDLIFEIWPRMTSYLKCDSKRPDNWNSILNLTKNSIFFYSTVSKIILIILRRNWVLFDFLI